MLLRPAQPGGAMSPRRSGKAVELKGLPQNGEVEPCGSALAEQIVHMRGQ